MTTLQLQQLSVPPGKSILIHDLSWQEFENILEELGEHRSARVAYDQGTLEIMTPLPEHEADKEMIGDLLKALLEELDIEFLSLGSTTFKNSKMLKGIEPDQCFYIQNEAAVRGKKRLDLTIDPPPDLAIEIDVTSRTHPDTHAALGVPELWRRAGNQIQINILNNGQYLEAQTSSVFPTFQIQDVIPQYIEMGQSAGRNKAMKAFRQWVREQIK
ncbi:MAG: Uma2 family endonuclease [Leptolyngbyaceae cyanobacterium CSU_1_4]|nr:Uma2 family endonuclease [Leptolyngbyaceae cyanobacterium CSU_1_4]